MQSMHFTTGINPQNGGPSYRSMVYEAMVALPNTVITPSDMVSLFPNHKAQAIKDALADIILYPSQYPGLHRIALSQYKYDPTTPSVISKFPNMGRKSKGKRKTITIPLAPTQTAPKPEVAPATASTDGVPTFSTILPIFDRTSGSMVSTSNEVMLVDTEGRYWHAKRV